MWYLANTLRGDWAVLERTQSKCLKKWKQRNGLRSRTNWRTQKKLPFQNVSWISRFSPARMPPPAQASITQILALHGHLKHKDLNLFPLLRKLHMVWLLLTSPNSPCSTFPPPLMLHSHFSIPQARPAVSVLANSIAFSSICFPTWSLHDWPCVLQISV